MLSHMNGGEIGGRERERERESERKRERANARERKRARERERERARARESEREAPAVLLPAESKKTEEESTLSRFQCRSPSAAMCVYVCACTYVCVCVRVCVCTCAYACVGMCVRAKDRKWNFKLMTHVFLSLSLSRSLSLCNRWNAQ